IFLFVFLLVSPSSLFSLLLLALPTRRSSDLFSTSASVTVDVKLLGLSVTYCTRRRSGWRNSSGWLARYVASSSSVALAAATMGRSEEHTSELQSRVEIVCRLLLEKKKNRGLW